MLIQYTTWMDGWTIHNINLPRLQDNVMHFVALSPTRTAAKTRAKTAAPNMNPPSHPTATLVVWSSQSSLKHVTKSSYKTLNVTVDYGRHTEH